MIHDTAGWVEIPPSKIRASEERTPYYLTQEGRFTFACIWDTLPSVGRDLYRRCLKSIESAVLRRRYETLITVSRIGFSRSELPQSRRWWSTSVLNPVSNLLHIRFGDQLPELRTEQRLVGSGRYGIDIRWNGYRLTRSNG